MILLFKFILIAVMVFAGYKIFFQFKFQLLQRFLFLGIASSIVVFILFPSLTMPLAHFFGIGRGVDFIFYLSHVFLFYGLIRLYSICVTMRADITQLVRELALLKAEGRENKS